VQESHADTARLSSPASMRTSCSNSRKQEHGPGEGRDSGRVTEMMRAAEARVAGEPCRRQLAAAALTVELGRRDVVAPLLNEVSQLELGFELLGDLAEATVRDS
jgi:hypothetical protein